MDRILQNLSDYALGLSNGDLPEEVVDRAKHLLADTLGCALSTAQSPPAALARTMAAEVDHWGELPLLPFGNPIGFVSAPRGGV